MKSPERIGKILQRIVKDMGLEERMKDYAIIEKWPQIVGERIARHTRATSIDANNLYVIVDNPVWKAQLFLMKDRIIKKINNLGVKLKDIKFKIG